ncbi:MAG TPA: HAMP domain-containing sensor histidine kinase [Acidimicrobiia bacterium]|jgi:two-component system sensor histidine kinase VanS
MERKPGPSVRLKLTFSYAGFLMLAGVVLLAAVWWFLLRHLPFSMLIPDFAEFFRALHPANFGPAAFGPAVVVVLTFLLGFGMVGGWLLAGRMLAPLDRITEATRRAAAGSLSHRVELEGHQDEFRELADSFDAMLARIEAHVAEQQRFAANASHELRTPLAITKTLLDVARNDPGQDLGQLVERLREVNARAIELTEALLLLNRTDQKSFTKEAVDLSLIAEEATETLLPLAEKRNVAVEASGDVTPTTGSHALLLQMTSNLVHNAIVHNLPEGGTVRLVTEVDSGSAVLRIENTGEQLSPALIATLTEPFQRATERIRSDQAGVGLGLAIVKSIVDAHDGEMILHPGASGGLRVTIRLPLAPDQETVTEAGLRSSSAPARPTPAPRGRSRKRTVA